VRLHGRNGSDQTTARMLDIAYYLLSTVQFHQVGAGGALLFATRAYPNYNYIFPITLAPQEER
jgi:hypothetical protein